jgi:parallel beta helix pectate lyase-like protein
MNKSNAYRSFILAAFFAGFSTMAFGQATRTWVSGVGDDLNPCSRTAPCKTFAGAISKTAEGGEIDALDPAGYGTLTITKSITIDGGTGSGWASVLNSSTNGFNVNVTTNPSTSVVILRNITINGVSKCVTAGCQGLKGIRWTAGNSLQVENCVIENQATFGMEILLTAAGQLDVQDTTIENIGTDGVNMNTTAGILVALFDHSRIKNCGQDGIEAQANVRGELTGSLVAVIGANGVSASGANTQFNINDSTIAHCSTTGLRSSAGDTIRVSDSIIANNNTGLNGNGGAIDSFQGNSLVGNPVPGGFNSTTNKQ